MQTLTQQYLEFLNILLGIQILIQTIMLILQKYRPQYRNYFVLLLMAYQFSRFFFPQYIEIIRELDIDNAFFYMLPGFIFNTIIILDILLTHWKVQILISSLYLTGIVVIVDIEVLKKSLMVGILQLVQYGLIYYKQKKFKELFEKKYKQSQKTKSLLNLLYFKIPCPLIVVQKKLISGGGKIKKNQRNLSRFGCFRSSSSSGESCCEVQEEQDRIVFQNQQFQQLISEKIFDQDQVKLVDQNSFLSFDLKKEIEKINDQQCDGNNEKSQMYFDEETKQSRTVLKKERENYVFQCYFQEKYYEITLTKCNWENFQEDNAVIVTFYDNTHSYQLRQAERQKHKELSEYKDSVLRSVSHDLRTPLIAIQSNAELIKQNPNIEEYVKEQAEICVTNCKMLQLLVNDVLDYSQIQAKGDSLKIRGEQFFLDDIFNEIKDIFQYQCKQKQIYLKFDIEKGNLNSNSSIQNQININNDNNSKENQNLNKIRVNNDVLRLKQVLMNLVSNAIKFTSQGGVTVKAKQIQPKEGQQLETDLIQFEVIDTGRGITEDQKKKLFHLYSTFNQEGSSENHHGIGLGLTIAKTLTGVIGPSPDIHVSTLLGKGSNFSFLIYKDTNTIQNQPKNKDNYTFQEDNNNNTDSEMDESVCMGRSRIGSGSREKFSQVKKRKSMFFKKRKRSFLIVDDNIFNIKSLEGILKQSLKKSFDIIIDYCMNGEESLRKIREKEEKFEVYDIIFMDINMPVKNGIETVKEVNQLENQKFIHQQTIWLCSADYDKKSLQDRYQNHLRVNRIEQKPILQDTIQDYIVSQL